YLDGLGHRRSTGAHISRVVAAGVLLETATDMAIWPLRRGIFDRLGHSHGERRRTRAHRGHRSWPIQRGSVAISARVVGMTSPMTWRCGARYASSRLVRSQS